MVVENDQVPRPQHLRRAPLLALSSAREPHDAPDAMVRRQSQRVTLDGLQPQERLAARCKETLRTTGVIPTVYPRNERASDQLAHLPRSLARVHPGVTRHARVGAADLLAVGEVVGGIDAVDEDNAGFGVVVGSAHHAL